MRKEVPLAGALYKYIPDYKTYRLRNMEIIGYGIKS